MNLTYSFEKFNQRFSQVERDFSNHYNHIPVLCLHKKFKMDILIVECVDSIKESKHFLANLLSSGEVVTFHKIYNSIEEYTNFLLENTSYIAYNINTYSDVKLTLSKHRRLVNRPELNLPKLYDKVLSEFQNNFEYVDGKSKLKDTLKITSPVELIKEELSNYYSTNKELISKIVTKHDSEVDNLIADLDGSLNIPEFNVTMLKLHLNDNDYLYISPFFCYLYSDEKIKKLYVAPKTSVNYCVLNLEKLINYYELPKELVELAKCTALKRKLVTLNKEILREYIETKKTP